MTDDMAGQAKELVDRINGLARGFMHSQVLFEANEAGVFGLLEEPHTAGDVAEFTGWDTRAARMLLDALLALELLEKENGRYWNTPTVSKCLIPGRPAYQGHIISHMYNLVPRWARLGDALSAGTGARSEEDRDEAELRSFILGMSDIGKFSAAELFDALDLSGRRHLLDIGGGPGTYALTFLAKHPETQATLFDLPPVLDIAREEVEKTDLAERMTYRPGDMTTDDLGEGYDVALLSNIIHMFGPEQNLDVFRRCYSALAPGGLFIIKDFLVDDDRSGPPFSLLFALNMLVGTENGDTYTYAEVDNWASEAGFVNGRSMELTPQSRLWLCEKGSE